MFDITHLVGGMELTIALPIPYYTIKMYINNSLWYLYFFFKTFFLKTFIFLQTTAFRYIKKLTIWLLEISSA